jgi:hypothetical protein
MHRVAISARATRRAHRSLRPLQTLRTLNNASIHDAAVIQTQNQLARNNARRDN